MRLVEVAEKAPRTCAVTGRGEGPFIDFNVIIDRPGGTNLYLHALIVEEAAKKLGMVPGRELEKLQGKVDELSQTLDRVEEIQKTAGKLDELIGSKEE